MTKLSKNTQVPQCDKTAVITRFFISIVYIKQYNSQIETALRVLFTENVRTENEALGYAIKHFEEEMKEFTIANKIVMKIDSGIYNETDMIESAKYGYEYHATTSFPNKSFEDNCKNNFLQHLSSK
jgi:hypothetical protein